MSQYEIVKDYIKWYKERYEEKGKTLTPIFEILLFPNHNKELIYHKPEGDVPSGFPDTGGENPMGYYYELETAIQAMNENWCDIQETVFHAGFVLCRFPGLYTPVPQNARIYFLWDQERGGFFETEEPEIFKHIAY